MTAPTQRPASTSDAAKRKAETEGRCWRGECRTGCYYPDVCSERAPTPAEPDADERLRERAEAFLIQCGPCDAGLPMGCACPDADPRPVIAELLDHLTSRTPDAHLAAAKAEALEEAAADPALRLSGHSGVSVRALRARAAGLREQGGE